MDIPSCALNPSDRGRLPPPYTAGFNIEVSGSAVRKVLSNEILELIRSERFGNRRGLRCPHCCSEVVVRWGKFSGRQRYRCKSCERTFSDLTGTPLRRTKKLHLWAAFSRWMALGASVRAIASALDINKDTALRWRHEICRGYDQLHGGPVTSPAVAVATAVQRVSESGRRPSGRPSRSTGRYPYLGLVSDREQVWILFLASARGLERGYQAMRIRNPRPTPFHWRRALGPLLPRPSDLLIRGGRSINIRLFSLREGHRALDPVRSPREELTPGDRPGAAPTPPETGLEMLRRAESHRSSWRRWSYRFRGVATRYLRLYLAWHRHLLGVLESPENPQAGIGLRMLAPALARPAPLWAPASGPTDEEWFTGFTNSSLGQSASRSRVATPCRRRLAPGCFDGLLRSTGDGPERLPESDSPPPDPNCYWDAWWASLSPRKVHRMSLMIDRNRGSANPGSAERSSGPLVSPPHD